MINWWRRLDLPLKVMVITGGLIIFLAWLMYKLSIAEIAECKAKGGKMIFSHIQTTYIMSGNVMVPITARVSRCNK